MEMLESLSRKTWGDRHLFHIYDDDSEELCDECREQAIALIAKIQKATDRAYETHSIASRLLFDEAKLSWELDFFSNITSAVCSMRIWRHAEVAERSWAKRQFVRNWRQYRVYFAHRDYHASNLMIDGKKRLRVVDHQDARMGPASYDLVSFLLDRQPCPPSLRELRAHRLFFLDERRLTGLGAIILTTSPSNFDSCDIQLAD